MHCGATRDCSSFSYLHVSHFATVFPDIKSQLAVFIKATQQVEPTYTIQIQRQRVQGKRLYDDTTFEGILWETTTSLSTDPRDKVYGLLAIAPSAVRDRILVDYDRTVEAICVDVMRYSIDNLDSLSVLSLAGMRTLTDHSASSGWLRRFDRRL